MKKNIKEKKQETIDEIINNINNSPSIVFFEYSGLSVFELTKLRKLLKENDAQFKIYKNSLTKRALSALEIDLEKHLVGPKAMAFGNDPISPIKILANFSKKHKRGQLKVGYVEGQVVLQDKLTKFANIPSREGLLTMLAAGLIEKVRDLSICLDLYAKKLEKQEEV